MLDDPRPRARGAALDRTGAAGAARRRRPTARRRATSSVRRLADVLRAARGRRVRSHSSSRTCTGRTRALLDFIDHVLEWSRNVPILIITLARPELLETPARLGRRAPQLPGPRPGAARPTRPMRELLAGLVPGLPAPSRRVDRRPRRRHPAVRRRDDPDAPRRRPPARARGRATFEPVGELGELAVPETLQALIAARLDGLDPADRALVQDAAVLGQSFTAGWPGGGVRLIDMGVARGRLATARSAWSSSSQDVDPRSPERGMYDVRPGPDPRGRLRHPRHARPAVAPSRRGALLRSRSDDEELAGALAAHYIAAYRAAADGPEGDAVAAQARARPARGGRSGEALGSQRDRPSPSWNRRWRSPRTTPTGRTCSTGPATPRRRTAARTDLAEGFLTRPPRSANGSAIGVALARDDRPPCRGALARRVDARRPSRCSGRSSPIPGRPRRRPGRRSS